MTRTGRYVCLPMTQSGHRRKPANDRNGHGLSFGRMQAVGFLQSERPAELSVLAVARDSPGLRTSRARMVEYFR